MSPPAIREPAPMEDKKSDEIRLMFGGIARRYDFLNHFLSLGTDVLWRASTVRRLGRYRPHLPCDGPMLDLCCGTGDLSFGLARLAPVIGCDFTHHMLELARVKSEKMKGPHRVHFVEGDAMRLPFSNATFSLVAAAFGVRNFSDRAAGLKEMFRVLAPGGAVGVLEFSQPALPGFRQLFRLYFHGLLPRVGRMVSGRDGAYDYLPGSVEAFPDAAGFSLELESAGFREVAFVRFTFGVAALHLGKKPK